MNEIIIVIVQILLQLANDYPQATTFFASFVQWAPTFLKHIRHSRAAFKVGPILFVSPKDRQFWIMAVGLWLCGIPLTLTPTWLGLLGLWAGRAFLLEFVLGSVIWLILDGGNMPSNGKARRTA